MNQDTIQRYLNATSEDLRREWDGLVRLALELPVEEGGGRAVTEAATALAFASRAGTDSIKRKILAIQHARAAGMAPEEIMAQGQEITLSGHQTSRRVEQLDQKVWLQWKVTGAVREVMQEEYRRICDVLKFDTADMFFTFLHAQLVHLSPAELKHMAGEPAPPSKSKAMAPTGQRKAGRASAASQPHSTGGTDPGSGTGGLPIDEQAGAGHETSDDEPQ